MFARQGARAKVGLACHPKLGLELTGSPPTSAFALSRYGETGFGLRRDSVRSCSELARLARPQVRLAKAAACLAEARASARAKAGGERGIRTLGRVSPTHAFQACSFNHSDISPL